MGFQQTTNSQNYAFRLYGKFSSKEIKQLVITAIISGFIIGFNDKRGTTNMDAYYVFFMIFSMLVVTFALLAKLFIQRYFMIKFGQKPTYNYSINSLFVGIILIFASNGLFWFLSPGYTMPSQLQGERLGKWRYGLKYVEHGRAIAFGIFGLVLLAVILKFFERPDSVLIPHMIKVIIALAIFSMLPLPECDGLIILFSRRWLYIFTLVLVVATAILLKLASSGWAVLFGSLIIAGGFTIVFIVQGEKLLPGGG